MCFSAGFPSYAGATGHIGLRIALEVSKSGIQTSALIRQNPAKTEKRDANLKKLQEAGISLVEADLADEERLIAVLKKSDVVVSALSGKHCLATIFAAWG